MVMTQSTAKRQREEGEHHGQGESPAKKQHLDSHKVMPTTPPATIMESNTSKHKVPGDQDGDTDLGAQEKQQCLDENMEQHIDMTPEDIKADSEQPSDVRLTDNTSISSSLGQPPTDHDDYEFEEIPQLPARLSSLARCHSQADRDEHFRILFEQADAGDRNKIRLYARMVRDGTMTQADFEERAQKIRSRIGVVPPPSLEVTSCFIPFREIDRTLGLTPDSYEFTGFYDDYQRAIAAIPAKYAFLRNEPVQQHLNNVATMADRSSVDEPDSDTRPERPENIMDVTTPVDDPALHASRKACDHQPWLVYVSDANGPDRQNCEAPPLEPVTIKVLGKPVVLHPSPREYPHNYFDFHKYSFPKSAAEYQYTTAAELLAPGVLTAPDFSPEVFAGLTNPIVVPATAYRKPRVAWRNRFSPIRKSVLHQRDHLLGTIVGYMRRPLQTMYQQGTGKAHPDFPSTWGGVALLTEGQLDSLATFYHQTGAWNTYWLMYPCPVVWNFGDNVWVKRRKMMEFMGLRRREKPAVEVVEWLNELEDECVRRVEAYLDEQDRMNDLQLKMYFSGGGRI